VPCSHPPKSKDFRTPKPWRTIVDGITAAMGLVACYTSWWTQGKSRPRAGAWFDRMKGLAGFTAFDLCRSALGKTSAMLVTCRKPS